MSEITKAIVAAQIEISAPVKDKINPRFKTAYSSLDAIYNAVRKPLAKHGLTLSHSIETVDGKSILVTTIRHISGEEINNKIPLFIENQTSQGFASALTYARRYATCSFLSLPSDEDDDGEVAENPGLNRIQEQEIIHLIKGDESFLTKILKGYGKESLKEIPASEFNPLKERIKAYFDKVEKKNMFEKREES